MNSNSSDATATSQPRLGTESANETNSNADTCCLGGNFAILKFTTGCVDVCAHDKSIKPPSNAPVVSGATAWDDPVTGQTCVLVINPNQICSFGIDHWDDPFDASRPISIGPIESDLIIPLSTVGTEIQFIFRAPTPEELLNCPHIQSTSKKD